LPLLAALWPQGVHCTMEYVTELRYGKTRKKVEPLTLSLSDIKGKGNNWTYRVVCSGAICENRTLEGNSAFDCIVLGMAFLRQSLRTLKERNPGLNFYEEIEGRLEKVEIEDIFWVHDCVPE
ncbi:hypothetical protein, partial [Microbulbifer mangrovi]|uniref:hypothetical protein n=1 Tax=Microbulbifer mangrovi TaxID=927787 RepID=UPI001958A831